MCRGQQKAVVSSLNINSHNMYTVGNPAPVWDAQKKVLILLFCTNHNKR